MAARAVLAPRRCQAGYLDANFRSVNIRCNLSVALGITAEIVGSRASLGLPTSVPIGDWSSFRLK